MANFKTRARALDLLGRQQIAGIPTAINELLKNAHDAYADNVDIDYFRTKNLFILRDDGVGMSRKDFETRWLTLGTESKTQHLRSSPPPIDSSKKYRTPMGEKGIGRLAIASIGEQVLIVTKPKKSTEIIAAFINWQVFEIPGLNLDDVIVPIRSFKSLPNSEDVESMKEEMIKSLRKLLVQDDIFQDEFEKIYSTVNSFEFCLNEFSKRLIRFYGLEGVNDSGTLFVISPVNEVLMDDLDKRAPKEATKIEKMLMGFHNTMTPNHPKPLLDIVFRDYRSNDGAYVDVINKEHFFTVDDFESADHHIKGHFDEYGQFNGAVRIYHDKELEHIINWNGNQYKKTSCGPFEINFSYIQGRKVHSIINEQSHARIMNKADKFGGLYVYRDNIRILPYGNSDDDSFQIDKRRSKHAGMYFFASRRMIGVISLNHKDNSSLKEKAGREGFIENKAYKELLDIVNNFLIQLAADFFRDDSSAGPKAEVWSSKRNELDQAHKALEKRNKLARVRKSKFETSLNSFFSNSQKGLFGQELETILVAAEQSMGLVNSIKDLDEASQKIIDIESETRTSINEFRKSILVSRPTGFLVKGELREDYNAYLQDIDNLDASLFNNAFIKLDSLVENTMKEHQIQISKRKRLEQAVDFISQEARKVNIEKRKNATESANEINTRVKELTNELMIELDDRIRAVKDKFKTINIENESDSNLVNKRNELSFEINAVSERNTQILDTIIRQLEGIYWEKDQNNHYITNEQITEALGEEVEDLREKIHADVELSQLGLAVSIIHHEFNSTIKSIRSSLKDLRAWSDVNEELDGVYKNIKVSFEHLDGYLNLFTPLDRRLHRRAEQIKLLEVKSFLIDLFKTRMDRHNIAFKHTKGFARSSIKGYKSSFYPVFVNVVDNAIYWLNQSPAQEKIIRLHADDEGNIYISNNGLTVSERDKDRIFTQGFSRKENGRGMGLHISNEVLESVGYKLSLDSPRTDSNVTFKVSVVEKND